MTKKKSKQIVKVGIIFADPFSKNFGVVALAYSFFIVMSKVEKDLNIKFDYTLIGSSEYGNNKIKIIDQEITFFSIPKLNLMSLYDWSKIIIKTFGAGLIKIIDRQIIFDISEGDSYSDIYGLKRFNVLFNAKKFFNILNRIVILLPQTIGPFYNQKLKEKAFAEINKMSIVFARDKESYNYSVKNSINQNIIESIDLAFILPFTKCKSLSSKINVGLNISALLWNGGYTQNNQFHLKTNYKKLIDKILSYFINNDKIQMHLIGHVGDSKFNSVENDFLINSFIVKEYPQIQNHEVYSPIEAKNYISTMDFFIGSRMHACIAAYSSGVPVFPISYSRKFNGLFCDTLNYQYIGDCVNYDENEIIKLLDRTFTERDQIKAKIEKGNNDIINVRIKEFISKLKECITLHKL